MGGSGQPIVRRDDIRTYMTRAKVFASKQANRRATIQTCLSSAHMPHGRHRARRTQS